MNNSISKARSQKLNELKQNQNLDAILAVDNRGFCYYNDGFASKNYNAHGLSRLTQYFFPGVKPQSQNVSITVEGVKTITNIQKNTEGDILAFRVKKGK